MKIYIVRHGETNANVNKLAQGRTDEPLNENGIELAVLTGRAMKGMHFDFCISSPLIRASETAKIILRESGNDIPFTLDDRLLEMDFGDIEGKSMSELAGNDFMFYTNPFQFPGFPNGETIQDVCDRTQDFLKELIAKDDGKTYLVSTHGCAMRAMTNYLLEDPANFWMGRAPYNCSFTVIEVKNGTAMITDIDKVYYDPDLIIDHFK